MTADPYLLAHLSEEFCLNESDRFLCCKPPNHTGWHRAEDMDGTALHTWETT